MHRTKIREYLKLGAKRQYSLFRSNARIRIRPFRPTDRAEQDRIAFATAGASTGRAGVVFGIDAGTANQLLRKTEIMTVYLRDTFQRLYARSRDLGSDAVSGKYSYQGVQDLASSKSWIAVAWLSRNPS